MKYILHIFELLAVITMPTKKCAECLTAIKDRDRECLQCSKCTKWYDLDCGNVSQKRFRLMTTEQRKAWKCQPCYERLNPHYSVSTSVGDLKKNESCRSSPTIPVRQGNRSMLDNTLQANELSQVESADVSTNKWCDRSQNVAQCLKSPEVTAQAAMTSNIDCAESSIEKLLLNEMRAMRLEMSIFRETMAELSSTIMAQNNRLDKLESKIDLLESKSGEIALLEQTIVHLKTEIQERDQEALMNDVEISNFPETANENPTHLLLTVAKKLGVDLCDRDVVSAERAGPVRALVEGGAPPRPRPLVARLARRAPRDDLLRAARVRRGLTTEGMGLAATSRSYYINERLTRVNRQLFQKSREAAKRRSWKYVWTKDGRIFARREQGTQSFRIRTDCDIAKVFGVNDVSVDN